MSQKAPLIICAYVKVRLIEMQYIIIIIINIIFHAVLLYLFFYSLTFVFSAALHEGDLVPLNS